MPLKPWEATDVFSARTMTRSHPVFGTMTPQQYRNDRLARQRGSGAAGPGAAGPGTVGGAWAKVPSVRMDRTVCGGAPRVIFLRCRRVSYKLQVCGSPASGKPIGAVFPIAFAHFVSLSHFDKSHDISNPPPAKKDYSLLKAPVIAFFSNNIF